MHKPIRFLAIGLLFVVGAGLAPSAFAGGHVSIGISVPGLSIGWSDCHHCGWGGGAYWSGGASHWNRAPVYYGGYQGGWAPTYGYGYGTGYRGYYGVTWRPPVRYYRAPAPVYYGYDAPAYPRTVERAPYYRDSGSYRRADYQGRSGYYDRDAYYGR